ncbi:MAG: VanW family protein [Clostridia bacterium]|nr:VanW family protein [Clostridia bacterium]
MKKFLLCTTLSAMLFLLSGCGNNNNSQKIGELNNVNFSRTSITNDSDNNSDKKLVETELSNFATPLKSGAPSRITNIKLTCDKINGRILKNGEAFSFNEIVGPCTAGEGYKKAEIYVNKRIEFALGGGNCQVSTTLYNAAIAVSRN